MNLPFIIISPARREPLIRTLEKRIHLTRYGEIICEFFLFTSPSYYIRFLSFIAYQHIAYKRFAIARVYMYNQGGFMDGEVTGKQKMIRLR